MLATLSMLVAGLMYNLTVFYESISESIGCSHSAVALTFSLSQLCFCFGGLILGYTYNRVNFNASVIIASIGMGLGLFLSSQVSAVWQLYVCYAIIMGLCAGFIYKAVLSAVLPWFHDDPGLASGIMMMGAGLTAFVFNVPTTKLIQMTDWRTAMKAVALIAFLCTMLAAVFIRRRPADEVRKEKKLNPSQNDSRDIPTGKMMKMPEFYLYFIWSVLLLAGCTSITGNCIGLSKDIGLTSASAAILSMIISFFNAISRIFYGALYDRRGRMISMGIATAFFAAGALTLHLGLATKSVFFLVISFVTIGMSFGGVPTISSTYILKTFGRKYYASNFSVQGAYSIFSPIFGSSLFALLYGRTESYQLSFLYVLLYAGISVAMYFTLNRLLSKDQNTEH